MYNGTMGKIKKSFKKSLESSNKINSNGSPLK